MYWYFAYFRKAPASFLLRFLRRILTIVEPDRPSLALGAVRFLKRLVGPGSTVAEYGAGRSTLWLAKRAKHVLSVESDPQWYRFVRAKLKNKRAILFKTKALEYSSAPFSNRLRPCIVLVDGKYRKECFAYSWKKLKRGGWLVLDDAHRIEYRAWLKKYPKPTKKFADPFGVFATHYYLKP